MDGGNVMRICFVTSGRLDAVREEAGADTVCCPLPSLGEVSYERELRGETSCFEDVALRSKALKGVVVCGCYTDARGIRRKSAVVAERGRILGVSDLVNHIDGSEYGCGAGVRVYETACGRLGIVVGEDLCFPQVMETLSLSGADAALCLEEELGEGPELTLIRAQAFFFGLPIALCAFGYAAVADPSGRLSFAAPAPVSRAELPKEREYHLIETRRRLLFRPKREF